LLRFSDSTIKKLMAFLTPVVLCLVLFYFGLIYSKIPSLDGQIFGSIPLEKKIEKLIELEKKGGIDAIFLGASTVDFGISAKVFSEEVTAATGKKFVAFNFGTGGGDHYVWPDLARIVRLYAKPRYYFVNGPGPFLPTNSIEGIERTPFYVRLRKSQIGQFIDTECILKLMNTGWNPIFLSKIPNLRNQIITRNYIKPPVTNSDLYTLNEYGDSISYNHIYLNQGMEMVVKVKNDFQKSFLPMIGKFPLSRKDNSFAFYYNAKSFHSFLNLAFRTLIKQEENYNIQIIMISFPMVALESTFELSEELEMYNKKLDFNFNEISSMLNLKYLNARDDLHLRTWHVQDDTHYNTYAAEIIGKKLAEKFLNQSLPKEPEANADALFALEKDKNLGQWTAIIRSPSSLEKNFLVLKYLQNANTRILPSKKENVNIFLRLEKNISRIFKVERLDNNTFGVKIPENLLKTNALYAVDLASESMQSLGMPLESYHWEKK
jgi:hypothetical protein